MTDPEGPSPRRSDARSLDEPARQVLVWQEDGVFTKNPDLVLLPSGKLLCVFNATDFHWPRDFSRLTVIESTDRGRTWGRPRVVHEARPDRGEERWVTPRLSLLSDGRLVILCDQNDYRHCHEDQPPGIYAWFSDDEGDTWHGPHPTGIPGIEPDRVRELPDGTLLAGTHFMRGDTQKLAQAVLRSADGGRTWGGLALVASDAVHNFCEGCILSLRSGRLACIMRENNHNNYPSYLALSEDGGLTWTRPVEAPFSGDRPFAGQLPDGRTLVTFRNQAGKPGLYAWLGDLETESGYRVSRAAQGLSHAIEGTAGPASRPPEDAVTLEPDALVLRNGPEAVTRYLLLPPESFTSEVSFEGDLEVDGPPGKPAATIHIARIGLNLTLAPDALTLAGVSQGSSRCAVDLRRRRRLRVHHRRGPTEVSVDGEVALARLVYREEYWDRSFFGNGPDHEGLARWFSAAYTVANPTEPPHAWRWSAAGGQYPNQYEIDRWVELDYNADPRPDHGYSSWVRFQDGEVFVADYTNEGSVAGKARLKGYFLRVEDLSE